MNYYDKGKQNIYYSQYPKTPRHVEMLNSLSNDNDITEDYQVELKPVLNLFPIDEAFFHGTIFRGIYQPYKNYQPRMLTPKNEKEKLLFDVDKYYFALHEIRMYLDAYPNEQDAIDAFTEYQIEYIKAKHAYELKYGALDIESSNLDTSPWNWTMGRWPWESEK